MTVKMLAARGTNQAPKIDTLIRLWDRPLSPKEREQLARLAPIKQDTSEFGNINDGTPYPSTSRLVGREHPHFEINIETGVKTLVKSVGTHHNLVTYTSCGGHQYPDSTRNNNRRHVGIVTRDKDEYQRALALFTKVGEHINGLHPNAAIEIAIMVHHLVDEDKNHEVLDLYLHNKDGASWQDYFDQVDNICNDLVAYLNAQPSCS